MGFDLTRLRISPWWHAGAVAAGSGAAGAIAVCVWYWFAVADRYAVFLYGHVDRPWHSAAQPFDPITVSRYAMAPLVAAAAVSLALLALAVVVGHVHAADTVVTAQRREAGHSGRAEKAVWPWRQAWGAGALVLAIFIPLVLMTQNQPTLPWPVAAVVTVSALSGLALALAPVSLAVSDRDRLGWTGLGGLALIPTLVLWRAVELPARGMLSVDLAVLIAGAGVGTSVLLGVLVSTLRRSAGRPAPRPVDTVAAAAWWLFLFAPLVHHVIFTPANFKYITSVQNLVGFHMSTPVVAWGLAGAIIALCRR